MNKARHIYFITGASGVGKTTLVSELEKKYGNKDDWVFLHFDEIGIPTKKEMEEQHGSQEAWQKEMTKKWVNRMLTEFSDKQMIIFEGQVDPNIINDSFKECDFFDYTAVLIDSTDEIAHQRLVGERLQPELVNPEMDNWRKFLREQAIEHGMSIINTKKFNKEQTLEKFEELLGQRK